MLEKRVKVAVAMSGGVDSSVAAALLVRQGYEVIGLHLSFWKDSTVFSDEEIRSFPQNRCCSQSSLEDARRVSAHLGIPFYVLNFREKFKEKIVDYYVGGYEAGETPNPCVACNREMKFGALLERARELGATYLATGHYARVEQRGSTYHLLRARDTTKDQSYFLYHLGQDKLASILFPLGEYTKDEIVALARDLQLPLPEKKESQGICFIPDKKNVNFLKRHATKRVLVPGPIRDVNGTEYPEQHQGLALYTIGQREGIAIGGVPDPLYVVGFDTAKNTLIVGRNSDVFRQSFAVKQVSLTGGHGTVSTDESVDVAVRYRFAPRLARLRLDGDHGEVEFQEPIRAVTPGQSVVFSRGEEILGGGIIAS